MKNSALSLCICAAFTLPSASAYQDRDCVSSTNEGTTSSVLHMENSCGFPFPNDSYWRENGWVQIPDDAYSDATKSAIDVNLSDLIKNADGLAASTGFSAVTPVIFRIPKDDVINRYLHSNTFNQDGRDRNKQFKVVAESQTTGRDLSVYVNYDHWASDNNDYHFFQVVPAVHWPYGEKISVRIQIDTRLEDDIILQADDDAKGQLLVQQLSPSTVFTVRDQATVKNALLASINRQVPGLDKDNDPRRLPLSFFDDIEHVKINHKTVTYTGDLLDQIHHIKHGHIIVRDLSADGLYDYSSNASTKHNAEKRKVRFAMAVPVQAKWKSANVAIYIHDIGGNRQEAWLDVAKRNAMHNIATIAVNLPGHHDDTALWPDKIKQADDYLNPTPKKLAQTLNLFPQAIMDVATLQYAMTMRHSPFKTINNIEQYCYWSWWPFGLQCKNPTDLNTNKVILQGRGYGALIASTVASLYPERFRGVTLDGSGTGIIRSLSLSNLWDGDDYVKKWVGADISRVIPSETSASEGIILRAMMQHTLDYADPANHLDALYKSNKPIYMTGGKGDNYMPNISTFALANQLRAKVKDDGLFDVNFFEDDYRQNAYGNKNVEFRSYLYLPGQRTNLGLFPQLERSTFVCKKMKVGHKEWRTKRGGSLAEKCT